MARTVVSILVALALAVGCSLPAHAGEPLTNDQVAEWLLEQVLAEVLPHLNRSGREVALRSAAASPDDDAFVEKLASSLYDRGFDVWVLDEETMSPPATASILEFEVIAGKIFYPRTRRSFMSLGQPAIARRGTLAVDVRILGPGGGPWFFDGRPEARHEDWIEANALSRLAEDHPDWIQLEQRPGSASGAEESASWTERFVVASLLGGVIILYFSGAQ